MSPDLLFVVATPAQHDDVALLIRTAFTTQVRALGRGRPLLSLNTAEMMNDRVRLYERHGFVIVRRGPPDHGKDDHLRVYMEKRLTDGGGSAARDRA